VSDPSEEATPEVFSPSAVIAIVLVSVFAFAAFVTLMAYAPDLRRDFVCRPNVYSKCAVGFAGLEALVRQQDAPTLISRTTLPKGAREGLLIVTPEPGRSADAASLGFAGPVLVVLPKWETVPDPGRPTWGRKAGLLDPAAEMPRKGLAPYVLARRSGVARHALAGAVGSPFENAFLFTGPVDSLQTASVQGWLPVLTDETGGAVMSVAKNADVYLLADPDLLNTQGLADLDTLATATRIVQTLRRGEGPVMFDVSLDGYRIERNALKLMLAPPFLAVTLCLAAAAALAGLQALARFGPARRPGRVFALGKEALADNSAQLIRLARREARMAPPYAALTRAAAARAVAAPRELAGEDLTAFLDRLGAQRGTDRRLADLALEADRVRDRKGLTEVAQRLYRWRLEMTRERR